MTSGSLPAISDKGTAATVCSPAELSDFDLLVEDIHKSFGQNASFALEILKGVSFIAHGGEMVAIVGASGAGKSTLLHLLAGLEASDRGRIRAGTVEITASDASELARFRRSSLGYVYQSHRLLPDLSAEENVALPLLISRIDSRAAITSAREMLEAVGISSRKDHKPGELSGGEQQRAAIARALVTNPRLVLADEPTGNLDRSTGARVGELLFSLCRQAGTCVIVATHNEELAEQCDRILTLRDGRITEA